jgi:hypothetical protein
MYVYCNVMPASGALHPKYVEEIGTYETHPYKKVKGKVTLPGAFFNTPTSWVIALWIYCVLAPSK